MNEKGAFPDIPAGCYDPEHWRLANGMESDADSEEQQNQKAPPKPYLTEAILEEYLIASGITVKLNVVTHEVEVGGISAEYNPESSRNDLPVILFDELKQVYRCDKQTVCDLLNLIAGRNRYNPVLELIDCGEWDGTDYLGQLVEILGIRQGDLLSQTLLYKWSVQCYRLLHNQLGCVVGADGMLVLQGPQGIGKTSFVRTIGIRPDFVKLCQWLDPKDKDTLRRCTSAWIVELGEIETTLRSDLERLKAFVTNEVDEYRLPYARADNRTARRTSFTFAIDALDEDETAQQLAAASALARQNREVVIPEVDTYVYGVMCENAGHKPTAKALTTENIYGEVLTASQALDNAEAPETGRVLVVTPATYALLKKSKDVEMETDVGNDLRLRGVIAMLDGMSVQKIPANRLPTDFGFMVAHPCATTASVKLEAFNIHDNLSGISGALVEGRIVYDAFVLENKSKALYYQAQPTASKG